MIPLGDIRIRTAKDSDTDAILDLLHELGRPVPKGKHEKSLFRKQILRYAMDKDKKILVAESRSKLAGMISMILVPKLNRIRPEMYVPDLVVAKKYQRSGVGRSLMNSCIEIAKKKNCFRIRLESGYQRKDAHKFYKKLGFEQPAKTYVLNL